ncbi:MAG: hypothetical protein K1X57_09535 [Gemmataceae bacterium]|nr:hypothetical protein [Gemmataceae bacterium]
MRTFAAVFSASLCLSAVAAEATQDVPQLVTRLGASAYRDREDAYRALDKLGDAALVPLRAASVSADIEVRQRAVDLIRRIEQRQIAARILMPTLIEVEYTNVPVTDAIRDFANRTGLPVVATGDTSRMKNRKVTYKSGKVPVWDALAGFIAAANLTEWDGLTPMPGLPAPLINSDAQARIMMRNQIVFSASGRTREIAPARQVFVYDGTSTPPATRHMGAVRVRALPIGTPLPGGLADPDEVVVPLQVATETKIQWRSPPTVKIGSATDDRGQHLTASVIGLAGPPVDEDDIMMMNGLMINPIGMANVGQTLPRNQYVALRFRRGELPARQLREIQGTLTLPLRVSGEVAAIEQPMDKAGHSARAAFGNLTVHAIDRGDEGVVKLDVGIECGSETLLNQPAGFGTGMKQSVQIVGGAAMHTMTATGYSVDGKSTEFYGLSLADQQGRKYVVSKVGSINQMFGNEGTKVRTTITFKPAGAAGPPVRLALAAQHPASVELAFTFNDIPLP